MGCRSEITTHGGIFLYRNIRIVQTRIKRANVNDCRDAFARGMTTNVKMIYCLLTKLLTVGKALITPILHMR